MANHKVPQDVETADKLVGFLSLKQFIFVLAGFGLGFIAFSLAKTNFLLAIPFAPPIFVFLVLGLYQRKDQPVEVFLAAWLKYKFSPKARVWNQEGYEQHLIVTAPKKEIIDYTKGMTSQDVYDRLYGIGSKLDTRGWSTKGVSSANAVDLGIEESERLISISDVHAMEKRINDEPEPPQDVFDANNSPTATMVEVDVQKASQAQGAEALNLISNPIAQTNPTAQPAPHTGNEAALTNFEQILSSRSTTNPLPTQQPTLTNPQAVALASAQIPISAVAQQAQAINLEQGAEFSLH